MKCSVIVSGQSFAGKSCLINRIAKQEFKQGGSTTIGVSQMIVPFIYDGKQIEIHLFDTPGQVKYQSILSVMMYNIDIVVFVFDLSQPESLQQIIKSWLPMVEQKSRKNPALFLFGTKSDLIENMELRQKEIKPLFEKLKEYNIHYYFGNSREPHESGLKDLMNEIAKVAVEREKKKKQQMGKKLQLKASENRRKKMCCS